MSTPSFVPFYISLHIITAYTANAVYANSSGSVIFPALLSSAWENERKSYKYKYDYTSIPDHPSQEHYILSLWRNRFCDSIVFPQGSYWILSVLQHESTSMQIWLIFQQVLQSSRTERSRQFTVDNITNILTQVTSSEVNIKAKQGTEKFHMNRTIMSVMHQFYLFIFFCLLFSVITFCAFVWRAILNKQNGESNFRPVTVNL